MASPGCDFKASNGGLEGHFCSPITLILCVAGRRSGKTTISSLLMAWLARQILLDGNFLADIPLLPNSTLSLLNVACEANQARLLFNMLKNHLSTLKLIPEDKTPSDHMALGSDGRLIIESLTSSARSVRGRTAVGVCLDEFAHFQRTGGPYADRAMWFALTPSVATFGNKGLVVVTTSPAGRSGKVWELFQQRGERQGMLTLQVPTWVMNPHVPREKLDEEFVRDEYLARQEYGAEFLAPNGRFLKWDDIEACVQEQPPDPRSGHARWHIHVDLGLVGDATAIALGFIEPRPDTESVSSLDTVNHVVIKELDVMQGSRENPVRMEDVENRIVAMASRIPCKSFEVTFDQHQSAYAIERLRSRKIDARMVHATSGNNEESYAALRDLIASRRIAIPNHAQLLDELAGLECSPTPRGFKVEAASGGSDDCADAVAMCAWCLLQGDDGWEDMLGVIERG